MWLANCFKTLCFKHLFLLSLFLFSHLSNATEQQKIVLNSGSAEPFITADGGGFYGPFVKELFHRLNIDAKVIQLPSARSLINANEGIDDGVIARTKGINKKHTNLMLVPGKIVDFKFVAYSLNKQIPISGWESLKPYSVGIIRGWRIYENNVVATKKLTSVNDSEQLFKLLINRRSDLILFEYWRGLYWNKKVQANAHIIGSPIAVRPMFMYMHKKHSALIPRISKVITELRTDGTYQRIFDKTLSKLLQ